MMRTKDTRKARGRSRGDVNEMPGESRGYTEKRIAAPGDAARDQVIVIESDDNSEGDDDEGSLESVLPALPRSSSRSAAEAERRIWRSSTTVWEPPKTKHRPSVSRDLVDGKPATMMTMKKGGGHIYDPSGLAGENVATASNFASSKLSNGTSSTMNGMGSSPHQSASSAKGPSLASRHTLNFPSTPTSSRGSGHAGSQKVSTANRSGTLTRSSPSIPSSLPLPAVKGRIYSTPQARKQRNIENGLKKLESFGFVSASSLLTETNAANCRNVAPTHMSKSQSTSKFKPHSISSSIKQEYSSHVRPLGVHSENQQSLLQTTRNTAGAITPVPKLKAESMSTPTYLATTQSRIGSLLPSPRTPDNSKAGKQTASNLSSSIGTRGDPYSISSDSDSDEGYDHDTVAMSHDQGSRNHDSHNLTSLKSLGSFSEINRNDAHETASDVEAVLEQYPTWLDSPSPAKHRSRAMPSTATATTKNVTATIAKTAPPTWPSKRLWNTDGKKSNDNRRVRFICGYDDDAFSPSPLPPAKRRAVLEESRHPRVAERFASLVVQLHNAPSNSEIEVPSIFSGVESRHKDEPLVGHILPSSDHNLSQIEVEVNDSPLVITVSSDSESESDSYGTINRQGDQKGLIKQEEGTRLIQEREKGEGKKIGKKAINVKVEEDAKNKEKIVETRKSDGSKGNKKEKERGKAKKKRIKTRERQKIRHRLRHQGTADHVAKCRHRNRSGGERERADSMTRLN
ncbi:hypothetical protein F5B22DRAFT_423131 [Xylaria bambusicola]|uniref:uncharacterized protein n=1 Tax=Xylaria bambusicola TaxID=326684 RepID=UPI00200883CE|nr:uncharacterized protein F5B22DRAFT_423131 [Xylaria bambusicola]KAI0523930.1 hypothetical protein F5B22DRAFT_423131 [Xylaria bambusicola]